MKYNSIFRKAEAETMVGFELQAWLRGYLEAI